MKALDKFGGIDILVSNGAVNPVMGPILEVSHNCSYYLLTISPLIF